jgi:hypothetical protein
VLDAGSDVSLSNFAGALFVAVTSSIFTMEVIKKD